MITVSLLKKPYRICNTWEDVDHAKLIAQQLDPEGKPRFTTSKDELKALTNIPHDLIDRVPDIDLFPLYTVISFIHESELLPYLKARQITRESYSLFEKAKKACREGKPYKKIISAAKVYYPDENNSVRLIGLGLSIVEQIASFLEKYEDMIHAKPEKNEVEAGVEELGAFGHWGTAYVLAGRDILKINEILERPAIEVYTALHYSFKEHKYNKKKFDLDHPPKAK